MARRASSRRSSGRASGGSSFLPIAAGVVGFGALWWWLSRGSEAQAAAIPASTTPGTPAPPPPAPTATTNGGRVVPINENTRNAQLVERLRGNARARTLFYLQALWWAYGKTNVRPDGLWGSDTARIAAEIQRSVGVIVASPDGRTLDAALVRAANEAVWQGMTVSPTLRAVPDRLPQNVIDLINMEAHRAAGSADIVPLQALPAA